jgi:PAS domain S-box-containing protein
LSKAKVSALLADYDPPKVILKSLIDQIGDTYNLTDDIKLPNDHNFFTIHFRALSFIDESSNKFRIRIFDLDDGSFNEVFTSEPFLQLTNQSPGNYRFEIAARNFQSDWSSPLNSGIVTIEFPFYSTFWFNLLIASTFLFFAYSINRYYLKSKYASELEREVDNKTYQIKDYSDKFDLISKNITDIFWIVDKELRITFISDSFKDLFGIDGSDFIGDKFVVQKLLNKIDVSTKDISRRGTVTREMIQKDKHGNKIWTEIIIDPIISENTFNGFVAVTRDITARKNIDRIKAEAVTETSEIERNRISRELHDHIGQILASIKLRLEIFSKNNDDENVHKAKEQILILGDEVQKIIMDMNPIDRSNKNLHDHLCKLYERTKSNLNITVNYNHDFDSKKIPADKGLILYRIIQESLTNVVRHSEASIVKVKVINRKENLVVSITDNGKGFNKTDIMNETNRFGIISMKQRAKLLSGEINILSKEGWGSSIHLIIPSEELENV